jgi:predicted ester cyclase
MERAHYTAEEQRALALARQLMDDVFFKGDVSRIDGLVTESGSLRHPLPGQTHDRRGFGQMVSDFHAAFPGFDVIIEDSVVRNGVAVIRWTAKGTHGGPWLGVPRSGKDITVAGVAYCDSSGTGGDRRLHECWFHFDALSLLHQIGGGPPLPSYQR